jgi:hypothetical protein
MGRVRIFGLLVGFLLLVVCLCACAGGNIKDSGFLGDSAEYAKLKPGTRALDQVWLDPGVDFKKYRKIMLDEVTFYLKDDAESKAINPGEIKKLTDAFHQAFVKELGNSYPLVAAPGPDVLRVRIAIVDLEPSNPVLDTVTTVLPVGIAVSLVKQGTGGSGTGVGSASMEVQFIDSESGRIIGMGKDTKAGSKLDMAAKVDKWQHARSAFDYWAKSLKSALDDIAAGKYASKTD